MRKITIVYIFILFHFAFYAQTVYHVNENVQGGQQSGLDWANAFPSLQVALALAVQGDEIWVAKGIYYPTPTTDRTVSFVLKQGVKLYGGFSGVETMLVERVFAQNETILSGNIGDPSVNTDNSHSIVNGQGIDSITCLDGFILRHAYADAQGGALWLKAGAQTPLTCPVIRNCRFEYNYTGGSGAGMNCQWNSLGVVSPTVRNCAFRFNVAKQSGGAVFKRGPSPATHPFLMEDCIFADNRALFGNLGGGGVYLLDPSGATVFNRCLFERDSAVGGIGGALYYRGLAGPGTLRLDSCIFRDNRADAGAGFVYDEISIIATDTVPFTCWMNGCVFEKNVTRNEDGAAFIFYALDNSVMRLYIDNCTVKNNRNATTATCSLEAQKNSNIFLSIRNSQFLGNLNAHSQGNTAFALKYIINGASSKCQAIIENCIFAGNGSGIFGLAGTNGGAMGTKITNCTFFNNGQFVINKSWYPNFNDSTFYDNMYISNCIFWEHTHSDQLFSDNNFMIWNMDGYYIDHILVNETEQLLFGLGPNVLYETYPMFVDTLNYDFRLLPCSPAVNFGDNQTVNMAGLMLDLDGKSRIFGDTVDLGAYETRDTCAVMSTIKNYSSDLLIMKVCPNPVSVGGGVKICSSSKDFSEKFLWRITDMNGLLVSEGDTRTFDNSFYVPRVPGIYMLEIVGKDKKQSMRLVVVP